MQTTTVSHFCIIVPLPIAELCPPLPSLCSWRYNQAVHDLVDVSLSKSSQMISRTWTMGVEEMIHNVLNLPHMLQHEMLSKMCSTFSCGYMEGNL
jgi:hypothetical protein